MRKNRASLRCLGTLAAVALAATACGGDSKKDVDEGVPVVLGQPGPGDAGGHFPMQVGNAWAFDAVVTELGAPPRSFRSTIRSTGTRAVAGATATVFAESNADGYGSVDESVRVADANGIAEYGAGGVAGLPVGLGAYWLVRFPLEVGSAFVQLDKAGVDFGQDLDGDGRNETFDLRSVVTVVGFETVVVPAGSFAGCARVQTKMDLSVLGSGARQRVNGSVLATEWYAPGIGWVKLTMELTIDGEVVESDRLELAAYDVNGATGGGPIFVQPVTRIDASPQLIEVGASGTATVTATAWAGASPASAASLTWISEDPAVATVSDAGVVTGISPGTTSVYATAGNVQSNRVSVRVLAGRVLTLATNDMLYDAARGRIYASVPSRQGVGGNSVAVIDPVAGAVTATLAAGSEPSKLALSRDGRFLYVALDGAAKVTRFDLAAPGGAVKDLTFGLGVADFYGAMFVEDMEVMPGAPGTVAISRRYSGVSPRHAGVAIYDEGVPRATTTPGHTGANVIEFGSVASRLYGLNNETTEFGYRRMTVAASGVTVDPNVVAVETGFGADMEYAGGFVYTTGGAVYDAETASLQGTFTGFGWGALVEPDLARGVVYFLAPAAMSSSEWALRTYDADTFVPLATRPVSLGEGQPADLIRFGARGLAFRSADWVQFVDDVPGAP